MAETAPPGDSRLRLAELTAALSVATDLGMGQPMEHALCTCVLAVRLGESLGMSGPELREVYYQALLRYIGCNAQTYEMAGLFGDDSFFAKTLRTTLDQEQASRYREMLREKAQFHYRAKVNLAVTNLADDGHPFPHQQVGRLGDRPALRVLERDDAVRQAAPFDAVELVGEGPVRDRFGVGGHRLSRGRGRDIGRRE